MCVRCGLHVAAEPKFRAKVVAECRDGYRSQRNLLLDWGGKAGTGLRFCRFCMYARMLSNCLPLYANWLGSLQRPKKLEVRKASPRGLNLFCWLYFSRVRGSKRPSTSFSAPGAMLTSIREHGTRHSNTGILTNSSTSLRSHPLANSSLTGCPLPSSVA